MTQTSATLQPAYADDDSEAELHAQMRRSVWVDTERMSWSGSPAEGVQRKRLELIGGERPQLTTLVRFAPGSRFPAHTHDGGEEFLVLDGTFSDATGDHPTGSYVRNPPGTRHAPFTHGGCTLLVKLRQFQAGDSERRVIDTRNSDAAWSAWSPHAEQLRLHEFRDERVSLLRLRPGFEMPGQFFADGVELFVVEGGLTIGRGVAGTGSWLRLPPGSSLQLGVRYGGSLCLVKQGPVRRYRAQSPD